MFKTITDITGLLGECPVWCERTERLFWTDMPACELLALDPVSGEVQSWPLPEPLGSFALTADKYVLLMGLEYWLGYYNLITSRFTKITAKPVVAGTCLTALLRRNYGLRAPNKVWSKDIPYIRTDEDLLYSAGMLDLFSQQIVCWSIESKMRDNLAADGSVKTQAGDRGLP